MSRRRSDTEPLENGRRYSQGRNSSQGQNNGSVYGSSVHDDAVVIDLPGGRNDELEELESISMSHTYSGEWERLFQSDGYLQTLRRYGIQGKLRSSRFRSVAWKLYLQVMPEDRRQWLSATRQWRKKYDDLKTQLIINPRKNFAENADLAINNPLSQETESPWNQFFLDNELRLTIKQDVIRTYPRIEFFHQDGIRTMMVDALFIYAKLQPEVAYRQGMHELLAPLIFVLHCDHQAFLHASEIETLQDVVKEVLHPKYIEHDAFAMFCQIMGTVEPWYFSKEVSPTYKNNNLVSAKPFALPKEMNPSNAIIMKLTRIQDYLLKRFDPSLHAFLEKMDIAPQIYGIRWVRLLFGREFPMQDLLVLWDAIFADGISFDLVDFVFLAMLLYISEYMKNSDYAGCLGILMRYPPVGDVHYFVEKALYLREPNQQHRPPEYSHPGSSSGDCYRRGRAAQRGTRRTPSKNKSELYQRSASMTRLANLLEGSGLAERAANMMSGLSTLTRKLGPAQQQQAGTTGRRGREARPPGTLKVGATSGKISKSTSEPMNLLTDQSPDQVPEKPDIPKRGSTASLSQLEDEPSYSYGVLRSAVSTASLARMETNSMRSAGSQASLSHSELNSPDHDRYGANPRGKRGRKSSKGRDFERDFSVLMGRHNDLELLCRHCADKMDIHIDKLQSEMLRQVLDNEDELLLALAGLKQVRDVLKGILKPSTLFDNQEMKIKDNHYQEESPPSNTVESPPVIESPPMHTIPPENCRRAVFNQQQSTGTSSVDTSSVDSSSPEYSEEIQRPSHSTGPRVHPVLSPDGEPVQGDRFTSSKLLHLSNAKEIELAEINQQNKPIDNCNTLYNDNSSRKSRGGERSSGGTTRRERVDNNKMSKSWTQAHWWGN